ncbi:hypothetical protein JOC94_002874 [Bacillus thermophilus]|uniref:Uncharacterized protein n=1 Tax=Siminovitchia thermophila TaxID=1245522 RepID=A0ABS2R899_9BACI|nr:hypothetical protein [Siminovitchia thermophila]
MMVVNICLRWNGSKRNSASFNMVNRFETKEGFSSVSPGEDIIIAVS